MPARNEANVIEASVKSVLAQPEVKRLVVIDDGSTDGTGDVLRAISDPRLEAMEGQGPGEGECGKPAALAAAYERARPESEWLLFVDADVVLANGAAGALLDLSEGHDLVSVIPEVSLGSFAEHAVMPSVGSVVLARNRGRPFANGQVILIRRSAYEQAGGHRSVVREVLEDVRLAERVHAAGGRLLLADGRRIARTRMYESWRELQEGWTKNLFLLLGASRRETAKWIAVTLLLGWIGPVCAIWAGWPYGLAAYLGIFVMQAVLRSAGGAPWIGAVLAPLGALGASVLMLASMRRFRTGAGVEWKGRVIRGGGA
jgi:glycosyltransferase involved in cell wall biosynthesis